jgi:hypothetical protein
LCYRRYQGETFPLPFGVAGMTRHQGLFPHRHQAFLSNSAQAQAQWGIFRYRESQKKDSGSARQGETANTVNVRLPESP